MFMLIGIITTPEESKLLGHDYDNRYKRLVAYAITYLHNPADAQDVVQNAFTKIAAYPNGFMDAARAGDDRAMGYLAHVVRNCCFDFLKERKKRNEAQLPPDDPWLEQKTRLPDDWDGVDTHLVIVSALEQMSPEHRSLMVLRFHDGYSYQDISRLTGWPVSTVTNRIFRIRAKLHKEVNGHASVS